MTNRLWKPEKSDTSSINRGLKKEMLGRLRLSGLLERVNCKYCEKLIYLTPGKHGVKMLTLLGSEHKCKNSPKGIFLAKRSLVDVKENVSTENHDE